MCKDMPCQGLARRMPDPKPPEVRSVSVVRSRASAEISHLSWLPVAYRMPQSATPVAQTAVASTARGKNLNNALKHISAVNDFDLILAGEDVVEGKPSPEIYEKVMRRIGVTPNETLIFEDSAVGIKAASASGARFVKINI